MPSANESPSKAIAATSGVYEAFLRESLNRCSPETLQAALEFRKANDASHLSTIVLGIIERSVEPCPSFLRRFEAGRILHSSI